MEAIRPLLFSRETAGAALQAIETLEDVSVEAVKAHFWAALFAEQWRDAHATFSTLGVRSILDDTPLVCAGVLVTLLYAGDVYRLNRALVSEALVVAAEARMRRPHDSSYQTLYDAACQLSMQAATGFLCSSEHLFEAFPRELSPLIEPTRTYAKGFAEQLLQRLGTRSAGYSASGLPYRLRELAQLDRNHRKLI
ncbi:hypothetical protein GMRT_10940 [Giardia muris]|uniref:Uncharacterized protein n=1 Tax=Giardia muris TaxID=5742 RepID=A0A4Z1TD31_GIAMU|nr:hypothetical protein GMRT_10940 [Giardia muris]|eukprot:TNJ30439.1 hypothetical protein GMRT_10940 [Giardia muris]